MPVSSTQIEERRLSRCFSSVYGLQKKTFVLTRHVGRLFNIEVSGTGAALPERRTMVVLDSPCESFF